MVPFIIRSTAKHVTITSGEFDPIIIFDGFSVELLEPNKGIESLDFSNVASGKMLRLICPIFRECQELNVVSWGRNDVVGAQNVVGFES